MAIFAHPWWLVGLAGMAVPVLVHLFLRRPVRHQVFPPIYFVRASHRATRAAHRLKRLLLLGLRMSAVALAVLALARPMARSRLFVGAKERPAAAVLCFDTSVSMAHQDEGLSRLGRAKALAGRIVSDLPSGSRVAVASLDSGTPVVLSRDLERVGEEVARLKVGWSVGSLKAMLDRALEVLEETGQNRREVYLFTDMSRWAWRDFDVGEFSARRGTAVYVLAVAPDVAADVGLGPVNVERGDVPRNARVAVSSEVMFTGPAERLPPSVTVEFWVDGKLRDRRGVERPEGGGPARVAFSTSFETEGFHQGRLVLRGGSRLPANDRRHFTVRVRQLPRVVLARAESSDGAQAVAKVVEAALAPAGLKAAGKHTVDVRALPVEAVDDEVLKSCEVVIVTGSARGADGLWRRLRDFTARGGSVLVIPSAPDGAKEQMASFYNSPRAQAMLPVRVTGIRRPEEPAMLDPRGYRDAVLAEFHGGEDGDLTVPAFMKYVRVKPLLGSEIRLRFSGSSGGEPAIVEGGVGAGSVLFVTFSPHPEWSNLSSQPEVVVLMHSLVRHMAQREAVRYNFVSGAPISVALPKGRAGAGSPLAAGLEIIFPDGSRRPAGADGPVVVVVGAEPALPGNYTIVDAAKAAPVAAISIDVPHEETDLSPAGRMRASELAGYFSPGTLRVAGDAGELARASADLRLGHDLAPILVLLLAAVLLAEGFLANRFYRCARDRNAG